MCLLFSYALCSFFYFSSLSSLTREFLSLKVQIFWCPCSLSCSFLTTEMAVEHCDYSKFEELNLSQLIFSAHRMFFIPTMYQLLAQCLEIEGEIKINKVCFFSRKSISRERKSILHKQIIVNMVLIFLITPVSESLYYRVSSLVLKEFSIMSGNSSLSFCSIGSSFCTHKMPLSAFTWKSEICFLGSSYWNCCYLIQGRLVKKLFHSSRSCFKFLILRLCA